jgi:DNA helicase-2/ATP-dependent DNA helicase PcrA
LDLLADLNPRQRAAVTHPDGPLLIVAGVGTGKTTVITRRIAWLIAEKRVEPAEILALTFTEKAAAEMEERVDRLVPYGYVEAHIGTFHSFCDRMLRENAVLLGLSPAYRILTEAEQAIFLKEHVFELPLRRFRPLGNPLHNLRSLLSLFSRAKDEDVTPAEYTAYVQTLSAVASSPDGAPETADEMARQTELAEVYSAYQALLLQHGFVDFGDLIALTLRLLREHPSVLARTQRRFRAVLIDEFQDTNYAQFELLKLLATHRNITVCGDDDQSIYKFRGAAISNILGFQDAYPDADLVVLDENYRSTQAILDSAYRLIQNNNPDRLEVKRSIQKRLRSASGPGRPPHQLHFATLDEETDFVAATIRDRRTNEARAFSDFAVLVRSNAQATGFLRALNMLRIPWRFSGSRGLYDQEEIRAVIAFLRAVADPFDDLSIHYLASSFLYHLDPEVLARAAALAGRQHQGLLDLFRATRGVPSPFDASESDDAVIARLTGDLTAMIALSTRERTGEVLYEFLSTQTGTIERLSNSPDPADALRVQNLARLFSVVERFGAVARYDRVAWFVDYLDALIEAGDNPPVGDAVLESDAVAVMTIHQAKGLEFPIVFLVGLVSGRFPSADRHDPLPLPDALVKDLMSGGDVHRQEERRLFYVGMTRAREDVYFTSSQDVGGKRARKPSLFVSEALDLDAGDLRLAHSEPLAPVLRHRRAGETEAEKVEPSEPALMGLPVDVLSLSFRQVDDYLTCPLKYRYAHLLHIPVRPHHALIYGNAVHQAIRLYNLHRSSGRDTPLASLHEVFRNHWLSEGFLTRQHEELRLQEGLEALRAFHAYEEAENVTPAYVERRFSLVDNGVRLIGAFDRIDLLEGGGRLIDYKTASPLSSDDADARARDSRQLAIYSLAYRRLFGCLPASAELRFLTPFVVVGRVTPSQRSIEKAQEEIDAVAAGIRASAFPGEPTYQACRYCSYAGICPNRRAD